MKKNILLLLIAIFTFNIHAQIKTPEQIRIQNLAFLLISQSLVKK